MVTASIVGSSRIVREIGDALRGAPRLGNPLGQSLLVDIANVNHFDIGKSQQRANVCFPLISATDNADSNALGSGCRLGSCGSTSGGDGRGLLEEISAG